MLSQRFGERLQYSEEFVTDFIDAVKKHPGCCDEVWLTTPYGYPPFGVHEKNAAKLAAVAEKLRKAGIRVSLQVANTVGHGQYISSRDCSGLVYDGSPVKGLVGHDGTEAKYCFCWNDPGFRDYLRRELKLYAAAVRPHTVWIDDDLRTVNHSPVSLGCFCPDCVDSFNAENGFSFTREQLCGEINNGDGSVREKWIGFVRAGLASFAFDICGAIHEASPETYPALQNGANGGYSGTGLGFIFEAMERAAGKKPKFRPGGGAYHDTNPNEMLVKMEAICWQKKLAEGFVDEIRPEIEALPDVCYGKTPAGFCMETSLYLAAGADAMSYAQMQNENEPFSWHEEALAAYSQHRAYWNLLSKASRGTLRGGIKIALGKEMWRAKNTPEWKWQRERFGVVPEALDVTAIPFTYDEVSDPVFALHPSALPGLSDGELEELLKKPVLTDGECAQIINERFPGALKAEFAPLSVMKLREVYTDHPVNGEAAGKYLYLDNYNFNYAGHAVFGASEELGYYVTDSRDAVPLRPGDARPFGSASAIVTTRFGAKWAVFGQKPWNRGISAFRRDQLLSAVDAISSNRLTAILETHAKATLLPREDPDGNLTSVSVLNCSVGQSGSLRLRLRRVAQTEALFAAQYRPQRVIPLVPDGDGVVAELTSLDPWTVGTLFIGQN